MPNLLRRSLRAGACSAVALLAACSSLPSSDSFLGVITPYRIEVVQGNVVTREMAELVQPGMSRAQVRDILGSPLLTDIFHADRWDYIFTIRRQGAEPQRRQVTAHFDGERLVRLEADELPGENEFVEAINVFKRPSTPPRLELTEEQIQALPAPAKKPGPATTAQGPRRDYPPLEP